MKRDRAVELSVVVPTFRRPELLRRALEGLATQATPVDEIIVVGRRDDHPTWDVMRDFEHAKTVLVDEPGVLNAMTAGARRATGEVIAFLDDDAVPRQGWAADLLPHFRDPEVGGVGGRDEVDRPTQVGPRTTDVGRLTRWGRVIGNHHLGTGPAREAQVLKGVNMAFRAEALALPVGLRGSGAQVHYEVATCLWARSRGWRLVYDPDIVVDHTVGQRFDPDRREDPHSSAIRDAAFNLVIALGAFDRWLAFRRVVFGLVIGDSATPGVARGIVALARRERPIVRRTVPSAAGLLSGFGALVRGRVAELRPLR